MLINAVFSKKQGLACLHEKCEAEVVSEKQRQVIGARSTECYVYASEECKISKHNYNKTDSSFKKLTIIEAMLVRNYT